MTAATGSFSGHIGRDPGGVKHDGAHSVPGFAAGHCVLARFAIRRTTIQPEQPMTVLNIPSPRRASAKGSKGEARRESIMDAAEEVFSDKGYYGSSMREISLRSGAALGLITHYFVSKDALFREVIDRKRGDLYALIEDSMNAALAQPEVTTASLIRAFIAPFVIVTSTDDSPLRHYVRLTSHLMSTYKEPELIEPLKRLRPISDLFSDALVAHLGIEENDQFMAALYLIESAMIFFTQDAAFMQDLSHGRVSKMERERFIDHTVTFFEGGVAALLARTET
jgi:AcrR family transcriptional regulator